MKQQHSWEITDAFWEAARPLIPKRGREPAREYHRKPGAGRPAMDCRRVLEAIFYVPRTGIQWKAIPKAFGAASSIHRYFRFWCEQGFFRNLWIAGLEQYDELKGIDWTWMSADGRMSKAPLAREAVHCQQVKKICAHFLPQGQKTGLSAPIPQPAHGRLAGFPLNPLRPKVYKTLTC